MAANQAFRDSIALKRGTNKSEAWSGKYDIHIPSSHRRKSKDATNQGTQGHVVAKYNSSTDDSACKIRAWQSKKNNHHPPARRGEGLSWQTRRKLLPWPKPANTKALNFEQPKATTTTNTLRKVTNEEESSLPATITHRSTSSQT
ncbi:hypothetical protein Nepgr_012682 [Nepenthes gracilis]|uniref:Uncharacterized protein n=1 Tax=Nepenthes gracilis TaxID=150966 RepID=A0AAD3SHZ1_NEPGR|nr:hypothetical protein Nepgr_012682 [Nepenthes gracilis]